MKKRTIQRGLITGASSGIGRAMALRWARQGVTIYAAARRSELLDTLAAESPNIIPMVLDVSKADETLERLRALDEEVGGLDLVVANAGVGDPTPAQVGDWSTLSRLLRVNVMGAAATVTALLPVMVQRGFGRVAGIGSIAAFRGLGAMLDTQGRRRFSRRFSRAFEWTCGGPE